MKEKEIISTNQNVWLLFCIITSSAAMLVPRLLMNQAGRDTWLAIIFAWFLDVLLAIVYAYMTIRFPGQNMVQYSITILGKKLGTIVGITFPIFFLTVSAVTQRELSTILYKEFFPKTPMEIILIASYIVIAYAVLKGIEILGRVCEVIGPIYFFSMILLFLLAIPNIKIDRLKPQLEHGLYPALSGTPLILSAIGVCIIMGMYSPICDHPENGFKAKVTAVSMGCFAIALLTTGCIGLFSINESKNMIVASLQLSKYVHMGTFLRRMEAIWLMIGIGAAVVTSASLIWAFCVGMAQILHLNAYKPLVIPAVMLSYVLGITTFKNTFEMSTFIFYSLPLIAVLVETGVEMFLFFMALILKKKG